MLRLILVCALLGGAAMYFSDRRRRRALDDVLVERVRLKMSRYVAHPGAVEVRAARGRITLSGSILAHEHPELLDALRDFDGVTGVVDHLSVFETADVL